MFKKVTTLIFATMVSVSLAACGGGDASCGDVADHVIKLGKKEAKAEIDKMPEDKREAAKKMMDEQMAKMGDMKSEMVKKCEKELDADGRKCAMGAKTTDELRKCDKKKGDKKADDKGDDKKADEAK